MCQRCRRVRAPVRARKSRVLATLVQAVRCVVEVRRERRSPKEAPTRPRHSGARAMQAPMPLDHVPSRRTASDPSFEGFSACLAPDGGCDRDGWSVGVEEGGHPDRPRSLVVVDELPQSALNENEKRPPRTPTRRPSDQRKSAASESPGFEELLEYVPCGTTSQPGER